MIDDYCQLGRERGMRESEGGHPPDRAASGLIVGLFVCWIYMGSLG